VGADDAPTVGAFAGYREDKLGTARALLPGILRGERPALEVGFRLPDGAACADAVVLFVGNNPYLPSALQPGARPRLDMGLLQVSVLRARTGTQIAAVLSQVATGRAGDQTTWVQWTAPAFLVTSAHSEIHAAIDGESTVLAAPLEFRTHPGALRVLVPTQQRHRLAASLAPLRLRTARNLWAVARGARPR
jgi:diacylglycerol kinase family enzyme